MCAFGLHLAFPLAAWWWIAPFALAGLIASWSSLGPWSAALAGYASGIVFFAFGFSWIGETAGALLGPAAPLLDLGPALLEAFAFAFAALLASLAARCCDTRFVPLVAAAAFALGEELRSIGVMGCPLEQVGVALIDSPLRALAAFAGGYGITFATALLGASLGWWLLDVRDTLRARTAIVAWLAVGVAGALAFSFWPARHLVPPARRVAAVQGGITQTLKMSGAGLAIAVETYTRMTDALAAQHPTLILWPETVILTALNDNAPQARALTARFTALAKRTGATLYVGAIAETDPALTDTGFANALFVFDPHAAAGPAPATLYEKEQLVPFAEYLPGPAWLRSLPYAGEIGRFTPGTNAVRTIAGATPLICWESLFGDIAHDRLVDDPSLFLIATDDAWFGTTEFPYEHALAASLRAVETGRYVLRAGATGISGIVAPDGTWQVRTALGTAATVAGDVGAPVDVPYAHLGPAPVGVVLAFTVALPFVRLLRTVRNVRITSAWRVPLIVAVLIFLGWIGLEIGQAGSDIAVQRVQQPSTLTNGKINGKRLFDGRTWTLDYDRVTMSPDGSDAHIAHVRRGRLHRAGKPDVQMTADDVSVNTVTNDLTVGGRVTFREPLEGGRVRTFTTTGARYAGLTRILTIDHPATITDGAAAVTVASLEVDFRTGDVKLGRVEGMR